MHLLIFSVNCVSKKTSVVVFLFVVNYFEVIGWWKFHINSFPHLNLVSCFGASSLFNQWRLQQHVALKLSCLFRNHSYEYDRTRNTTKPWLKRSITIVSFIHALSGNIYFSLHVSFNVPRCLKKSSWKDEVPQNYNNI